MLHFRYVVIYIKGAHKHWEHMLCMALRWGIMQSAYPVGNLAVGHMREWCRLARTI